VWDELLTTLEKYGVLGLLMLVLLYVVLNSNITISYRGWKKGKE
jgi:hypothetical protein